MTTQSVDGDTSVLYYDANADSYSAATLQIDMSEIRSRFLKYIPAGGRILDAGCGSGRDTSAFLKAGYFVTAFDASPRIAACATKHTGQVCRVLRFQELAYACEFDGVWSCAALLHVPKAEMHDVLRRIVLSLKLGGVAYFSFIEGDDERTSADGRFYNSYTIESMRQLIRSFAGVTDIESWKSTKDPSSTRPAPWLNVIIRRGE